MRAEGSSPESVNANADLIESTILKRRDAINKLVDESWASHEPWDILERLSLITQGKRITELSKKDIMELAVQGSSSNKSPLSKDDIEWLKDKMFYKEKEIIRQQIDSLNAFNPTEKNMLEYSLRFEKMRLDLFNSVKSIPDELLLESSHVLDAAEKKAIEVTEFNQPRPQTLGSPELDKKLDRLILDKYRMGTIVNENAGILEYWIQKFQAEVEALKKEVDKELRSAEETVMQIEKIKASAGKLDAHHLEQLKYAQTRAKTLKAANFDLDASFLRVGPRLKLANGGFLLPCGTIARSLLVSQLRALAEAQIAGAVQLELFLSSLDARKVRGI